jgi:signal peptide peptidase SppA
MKRFLNLIKNKKKDLLLILSLIFILFLVNFTSYYLYDYFNSNTGINTESGEYCNVQGILLRGDIYTYIPLSDDGYRIEGYEDSVSSEDISYLISEAEYNDDIKAILIEVDSYGGSPVAGEEIANEIKNITKPVIVYIRDGAVSAAYLAISSADKIFASKSSDIGGIGVTMSYLENFDKNQSEGIKYIQLSTGKFKDSGDPNKQITQEEINLFMRDLNIIHEDFIKYVSENRSIPIEGVRSVADGSTVLGNQAIEIGLIDQIGDYYSATEYISELIDEDVYDCWY